MRTLSLFVFLLAVAGAGLAEPDEKGVVSSKDYNFEIRLPADSIDWDVVEVTEEEAKGGLRAHFLTEWADSDPPSVAHLYVQTRLMGKRLVKQSIENIGAQWKEAFEGHIENARDRKAAKGKLGGVDCFDSDVTGEHATFGGICRRRWIIAKNGKYLYLIYIDRFYDAVDDEDLDEELKQILGSFKFHEIIKVTADRKVKKADEEAPDVGGGQGASAEEGVDPKKLEARQIKDEFWKFEATKPEGLIEIKAEQFSKSEKAIGLKFKAERRKDQTLLMIRVYVASLKSGQRVYTVSQLAESRIKYFEKTYKKNMRQKPKINKKFKIGKLTKDGISIKLVGRRKATEVDMWYIVDCKNDRQYQIQIYVTGGTGEKVWQQHIDAFLASFKPIK